MRVLFLTYRLPYAPNRGDRIRSFHIARLLASRVDLEVVSLAHERGEAEQAGALRALGARVTTLPLPRARNLLRGLFSLAGDRPLTHTLLDAPGMAALLGDLVRTRRPDVILAYCSGMARFALEEPLAGRPLVLDFVDLDSQKWRSLATTTSRPKRWIFAREARSLARFERLAALHAHTALVVNEREGVALRSLAPEAAVRVVPNGIDLATFQPQQAPTESPRVVFCGVMNYQPNVDAAVWFSRNVWPLVARRRPDARLAIVGSGPPRAVRRLGAQDATIDVTGTVADVRPYLWNAAVSVAPLLMARGIQNKVLEAVAAGLPTVVTTAVSDGLPPEVRPACLVADQSEAFAGSVLDLLTRSGVERREMAGRANLRALDWDSQLEPLLAILTNASLDFESSDRRSAAGETVDTDTSRQIASRPTPAALSPLPASREAARK